MVAAVFRRLFQCAFIGGVLASLGAFLNGWRPSIAVIEQMSESSPILCLFHWWTDLDCPGCGMTRAVLSFFSGSLSLSFYFHPLGPVVGLLICYIFLASFKKESFFDLKNLLPQKWSWSCLILIVAWGILRNIM